MKVLFATDIHGSEICLFGVPVVPVAARVIRNRQGIDLGLINKEIPVE